MAGTHAPYVTTPHPPASPSPPPPLAYTHMEMVRWTLQGKRTVLATAFAKQKTLRKEKPSQVQDDLVTLLNGWWSACWRRWACPWEEAELATK